MGKTNPQLDLRKLGIGYNGNKAPNYKRWKKQRIRWGFSTRDLWNMDNWLCQVIPDALDKLMDIKKGYPASWNERGGVKAYEKYVRQIAADIRKANKLSEMGYENDTVSHQKRMEEADGLIQSAFARLASIIWGLWD